MEEKKKLKISLKVLMLIIVILIIIAFAIVVIIVNHYKNNVEKPSLNSNDYKEITVNGETYYQRLNSNTWSGKYHQDNFYTGSKIDNMKVVSYSEYKEIIDSINNTISSKISKFYSNNNCNYIILSYSTGHSWCEIELIDCIEENNKIVIYGNEEIDGAMADGSGYFIAIPTNMPVGTEIDYRECYSDTEINNLKKYNSIIDPTTMTVDKPIIYLYPTAETNLTVKLSNADKITCSYPNYTNGWNVIAKPNGDLIDTKTNKNLYALYYESESVCDFKVEKEGFVVNKKDVTEFLEEKLAILGLTERETEEFIVYWLPQLQKNEYNYIRFASLEEINKNMPLDFSVEPDTLIRVLMTYKGLDEPIEVKEQQLQTPERTGFVAVEWGGTEIK